MLTAVRFLELLALSLWLGAMIFFAFIVAPAAFAVLPTRQLAGDLVGLVLARLHILGLLCAVVYLLSLLIEQRLTGGSLRAVAVPIALVAVILLLTFAGHYFLGERMTSLRSEMRAAFGSIDHTPRTHALRVRFNRYHQLSTLLMGTNLVLLLGLLGLSVRRLR